MPLPLARGGAYAGVVKVWQSVKVTPTNARAEEAT